MENVKKLKEKYNYIKNQIDNLSELEMLHFEFTEHSNLLPKYEEIIKSIWGESRNIELFHIDSETHRFQGVLTQPEKNRTTCILNTQLEPLKEKGLITNYKSQVNQYGKHHIKVYTIWFTH